jgi:hypothetical protein
MICDFCGESMGEDGNETGAFITCKHGAVLAHDVELPVNDVINVDHCNGGLGGGHIACVRRVLDDN